MPRKNRRSRENMKSLDGLRRELVAEASPSRGEVWLADLGERGGHIQEGVRPVLVINAWDGIAKGGVCTVLPMTRARKRWMPSHVAVCRDDLETVGCRENFDDGIVLAEQVTSIGEEGFIRYIGTMSDGKMDEISDAVRARIGL